MTQAAYPYQYIRYNNRYSLWWQYYVDNLISALIVQDTDKDHAFVITYQCTLLSADAAIEVYLVGKKNLIYCGTVMASARARLKDLRPDKCEEGELTETQKIKYFADDYIQEGYI